MDSYRESIANIETRAKRFNKGKPKWSLLDMKSLEPLVRTLEMGAAKYGENNWRLGLDRREILDSAMRHLASLIDGQEFDEESNIHHAGHVMANMMFYIYFSNKLNEGKEEE